MMMERKFSGRSGMRASALLLTLLMAIVAPVAAAPVGQEVNLEAVIESAVNSWTEALLAPSGDELDEQIFTEISPLIDSPEGIKLPDDQQIAD